MMKKILIFLTIIFSATILFGQEPPNLIAPEDPVFNDVIRNHPIPKVTGKLINNTGKITKELFISYDIVTPFYQFQIKKTATIHPDGSFALQLDYRLPYQQIWFQLGDLFYAGLMANKDLYIELDIKEIKKKGGGLNYNGNGVKYEGTDGPLNEYLNNFTLYKRNEQLAISSKLAGLRLSATSNVDSFYRTYNLFYDTIKQIIKDYVTLNPSPYGWMLENDCQSNYYGQILVNNWGKIMNDSLWKKVATHRAYPISNSGSLFYRYLAEYITSLPGNYIPIVWKDLVGMPELTNTERLAIDSLNENDNPAYLKDSVRYLKIKQWISVLRQKMQEISFTKTLGKSLIATDSLFSSSKADFIKLRLNSTKYIADEKLGFEQIIPSVQTAWCRDILKKEHQRTVLKVNKINETLSKASPTVKQSAPGIPVLTTNFGATLYKVKESGVPEFLSKLRQIYPGKAIIIDRWATWCAPCLGEMPHSKKLQMASKNLPVIFVYLCTVSGSTELKWKTKIVEIKQPGLHFLMTESFDAELGKYFSFSGYPGYAYIDKNGKYRPGAFARISDIENEQQLAAMIDSK